MEDISNIGKQVEFLSHELETTRARFELWLIGCCIFSIAVTVLALMTKEGFFFVVAGFGWFFVWNRWKCWRFVSALFLGSTPSNNEAQQRWLETATDAVRHPPSWWSRSENFSGAVLIALFTIVTYVVVRGTGFWMRILCAFAWGALIIHLVFRVRHARSARKNSPR